MTNAFTPGPWKATDAGDGYTVEGKGNPMGTVCILAARRSVTGLADAQLIAAAPELLYALKRFLIWSDKSHPEHEAMIEDWAETFASREENPSDKKVMQALCGDAYAAIAKAVQS